MECVFGVTQTFWTFFLVPRNQFPGSIHHVMKPLKNNMNLKKQQHQQLNEPGTGSGTESL